MPTKRLVFVSLVFFLVGCALQPEPQFRPETNQQVQDGGLLSKKPCGPPCFYGIVPGVATEADIQKAEVDQSDVFSNCSIGDNTSFGGVRGFRCDGGVAGIYNGRSVETIGFYPATTITVRQVIDLYGPPDLFSAMIVSLPDKPPRSGASLMYTNIQAAFGMPEQAGREFRIEPDTSIISVAYFSVSRYQEIWDASSHTKVHWNGFGTYKSILFP